MPGSPLPRPAFPPDPKQISARAVSFINSGTYVPNAGGYFGPRDLPWSIQAEYPEITDGIDNWGFIAWVLQLPRLFSTLLNSDEALRDAIGDPLRNQPPERRFFRVVDTDRELICLGDVMIFPSIYTYRYTTAGNLELKLGREGLAGIVTHAPLTAGRSFEHLITATCMGYPLKTPAIRNLEGAAWNAKSLYKGICNPCWNTHVLRPV